MPEVTAVTMVTPAKTPKKSSKPKKTGPTVSDRILKVVSASKDRRGLSFPALKKSLLANGYDVAKNNARIKLAVRRLVIKGDLLQPKGTGASGSFKINKNKTRAKKRNPIKKKARKEGAKKVKKLSRKKIASSKKSPKKIKRKAKSPKKAEINAAVTLTPAAVPLTPAAMKKTPAAVKKTKSQRKTRRRVSKPTRTEAAPEK